MSTVVTSVSLKSYKPASLRAWHWLNALVLLGLVGTMLLRKTFLSWRANAALIEARAHEAGVSLPPDLAKGMARGIRDVMWEWHYPLGFALAALLVVRVLVAVLAREGVMRPVRDGMRVATAATGQDKRDALHFTFVRLLYVIFYACVLFMACTGMATYFSKPLGLGDGLVKQVKEAHELVSWFFIFFVLAHLAGLVVAELTRYRGLVSDMIHGGDRA